MPKKYDFALKSERNKVAFQSRKENILVNEGGFFSKTY